MADSDAFTAEFSSRWRTAFSHIRGGSYNRTVVHKSLPEQEGPCGISNVGLALETLRAQPLDAAGG
jgi:hypothetical protein